MVAQASPERIPRDELDFGEPDDPAGPARPGSARRRRRRRARSGLPTPTRRCGPGAGPRKAASGPAAWSTRSASTAPTPSSPWASTWPMEPEVAADGVDELLDNLPQAAYFAPGVAGAPGDGEVLGFRGHRQRRPAGASRSLPDGFAGSAPRRRPTPTASSRAGATTCCSRSTGARPPSRSRGDDDLCRPLDRAHSTAL